MEQTTDTRKQDTPTGSLVADFCRDERGAVFLEFLIVLYAWMLLLFGVIQVGLIAIAAYYLNYGHFMAMRTASATVQWIDHGFVSESQWKRMAADQAAQSMGPLHRYFWVNNDFSSLQTEKNYTNFIATREKTGSVVTTIRGQTTYEYPLIVPFVNFVIAAFQENMTPLNENRVMQNVATYVPPSGGMPRLRMKSRNSIPDPGDDPEFNEILAQWRWRYNGAN
jgi:hypothetical protein